MQIYFVRHGESEANARKFIPAGEPSAGLTPRGIEQVKALAQQITVVNRILTSPMSRARETAEILAAHFDLNCETTDALGEFDSGTLKGKSYESSLKTLLAIWDDWILQGNWSRRYEGGESFEDIKARFLPFFESLITHHREKGETIVMVGHGGTFRAMLPLLLENIDFPFAHQNWLPNAAYVRAELRGASLVCTQWGDITPK